VPEPLVGARRLRGSQIDGNVDRFARLDRPADRLVLAAHARRGRVAVRIGEDVVRTPVAVAGVLHPPGLLELLAGLHDGRRSHIPVIVVEISHVRHAVDAWHGGRGRNRRGHQGRRRDRCCNVLDHLGRNLQVLLGQGGQRTVAAHLGQRTVQLRQQRRALADCDGEGLGPLARAHNFGLALALQVERGEPVHQHQVDPLLLQVAHCVIQPHVGEEVLPGHQTGLNTGAGEVDLVHGAALNADLLPVQVFRSRDRRDLGIGAGDDRIGAEPVRIGEVHDGHAVLRHGDGGDGRVHLPELKRTQHAFEREVVELRLQAQSLRQLGHEDDIEAVGAEVLVILVVGRIVERSAD